MTEVVAPGAGTRIRLLAPLQVRDFRLLWTGMTLSLFGDGVLLVALAWAAYQLSNQPWTMAGIGVALTAPQVVLVLAGGVVSDRLDRRYVMMLADCVRGAVLAVLGILALAGHLRVWHLLTFAVVYGSASAFFIPAFDALVPDVVRPELLVEANALDQFVRPAAMWLVGPAVSGVIVARGGSGSAFVLDAVTFAASVGCLLRMADRPRRTGVAMTVRGSVEELREGLRYVAREPWLWITLVAAGFTYLLFLGPTEVLLPYLVKNDLGGDAGDFGLILAAGGVSALVAAFLVGQTGLPRRVIVFAYGAWVLATLGVAGYALAQSREQAMIAAAMVAGFEALGAVAWTTTKQRCVPSALLGRISSCEWFISIALVPVSYALSAPAAAAWGARATLFWAGVLGALVTGAFLFFPGVQEPDRRVLTRADHEH